MRPAPRLSNWTWLLVTHRLEGVSALCKAPQTALPELEPPGVAILTASPQWALGRYLRGGRSPRTRQEDLGHAAFSGQSQYTCWPELTAGSPTRGWGWDVLLTIRGALSIWTTEPHLDFTFHFRS